MRTIRVARVNLGTGLDQGLFYDEQDEAHKHFVELLIGKKRLYSQIDTGLDIEPDATRGADVLILQTDIHYGVDINPRKLAANALAENSQFSHVLILDVFGKILSESHCEHKTSLFSDVYRSDLIRDVTHTRPIPPLGRITIDKGLIGTDMLGYRLKDENDGNTLEMIGDSDVGIAVVGGSFCASVYSLPGMAFTDIVRKKMASDGYALYGLGMGGCMQGDNVSQIISLGIMDRCKIVIFIDGLNDLMWGLPLRSVLGMHQDILVHVGEFAAAMIPEGKGPSCLKMGSVESKVHAFLDYRRKITTLIESTGVRVVSILQPMHNVDDTYGSQRSNALLPFYSPAHAGYRIYPELASMVKEIGKDVYGLTFKNLQRQSHRCEFLDLAHLSPAGEIAFADILMEEVISNLPNS